MKRDILSERIIADTCDEIKNLLIRKNHDYGNSFSKQFEKYGLLSGIIRLDDKMSRLDSLIQNKALVNESIEDTVADIAGYAILLLIELRKKQEGE
ncbi:hypothetical protein B4065_3335 [Caldibacillus thermoamylovorans]|uniref:nucleotide modification associated domain-containing protein n=1 Tax=Caldibacillus thermoamylovorans TaxID=35841 RepID=UPI0005B6D7BD|nr:nucleotide modification associated domain-containing protein [Caldibacillus thermoamylovorans]KIO62115.1 hypothetical protein B4065_3335 [Caldibacillus thermoamylovorans]